MARSSMAHATALNQLEPTSRLVQGELAAAFKVQMHIYCTSVTCGCSPPQPPHEEAVPPCGYGGSTGSRPRLPVPGCRVGRRQLRGRREVSAVNAVERGSSHKGEPRSERQLQHLERLQGPLEVMGRIPCRHSRLEVVQGHRSTMQGDEEEACHRQVASGLHTMNWWESVVKRRGAAVLFGLRPDAANRNPTPPMCQKGAWRVMRSAPSPGPATLK
jgi:hypothetical protein